MVKFEYKKIVEQKSKINQFPQGLSEDEFNKLGERGWELVKVFKNSKGSFEAWFKRERTNFLNAQGKEK